MERGPRLVVAGLAFGLGSGLAYNLGLAVQKRAALRLPEARGMTPPTARAFVAHSGWRAGCALILLGWMLRTLALVCAPVGMVVPLSTACIATQAWFARRWFAERLTYLEWYGAGAAVLGMLLIGLSLDPRRDAAGTSIDGAVLAGSLAACVALALLARALAFHRPARAGVALGAAAGLLFAGTGLLTKVLAIAFAAGNFGRAAGVLAATIVVGTFGVLVTQSLHQRGRSMVAVPMMNVLADAVPIALSGVAFSEAWPGGWRSAARALAFASILAGVVMLASSPGATRARGLVSGGDGA